MIAVESLTPFHPRRHSVESRTGSRKSLRLLPHGSPLHCQTPTRRTYPSNRRWRHIVNRKSLAGLRPLQQLQRSQNRGNGSRHWRACAPLQSPDAEMVGAFSMERRWHAHHRIDADRPRYRDCAQTQQSDSRRSATMVGQIGLASSNLITASIVGSITTACPAACMALFTSFNPLPVFITKIVSSALSIPAFAALTNPA